MHKHKYFLLFSSIVIFFLFFLAPLDTDLGWHLRYGEYFVKTFHFLRLNNLTYYLNGYQWASYYNLYEIIVLFAYKTFGLISLNVICGLLFSTSYFFFCLTKPRLTKISFFLFLFISFLSWQVFFLGLRPQLFSFLFFIITFYILERSKHNPRYLYILPVLFFIWVNVHGAFPFGLFILTVYLLDRILTKSKNWHLILLIAFISFLSTLLNPSGLGIYNEGFRHITYPLGTLIAEWVPPNFIYDLAIACLLMFTIVSLLLKTSDKRIFWLIVITFFAIFAFTARRNIPFFALVFVESLIFVFRDKFSVFEENTKFKEISVDLLIVFSVLYILLNVFPKNNLGSIDSVAYCNNKFKQYPCEAVAFLKEKGMINKNIFANYEWGGYLEWTLPQNKFFVDGRMPTWKTPENLSPYTVFLNVIQAQPGYETTLDKYKTDILLIGSGSFLDLELKNNKSLWLEEYRDDISVVYTRKF